MKKLLITFLIIFALVVNSFSQVENKIPLIGSTAPSFTAKTTNGRLKFPDDYGKSWKILFSHPADFTPVCTSEILELAYMQKDFDSLGVKIAIVSTDDLDQHVLWKSYLESLDYKNRGKQEVNFPIIDDSNLRVSKLYGMIHYPTSTKKDVRGVFIIDPNNVVRSINFYPMQIGRNMDEVERTVVALQYSDSTKYVTPANWNVGDDVIVPYYPYTKEQLSENPELKDEYYTLGKGLWFKKGNK